jgi:hypothetical protein
MGFKFLLFFDFDPEDWDNVLAQMKEIEEYNAQNPEPGSKTIFPGHMLMGDLPTLTKKIRAVSIVEHDDPDILVKSRARRLPDQPAFIAKYVRIDDMSKIIEAYEKQKT